MDYFGGDDDFLNPTFIPQSVAGAFVQDRTETTAWGDEGWFARETYREVRRFAINYVDLDIDSDNNDGFNMPSRSMAEDAAEDAPGTSGRIVFVNNYEDDWDSVPGFADGVTEILSGANGSNAWFVPVILHVSNQDPNAQVTVTLSYQASDPMEVTTESGTLKADPNGYVRLWTKDGNEERSARPVPGGDFIPPGTHPLSDFAPCVQPDGTIRMWLEGALPSPCSGCNWIVAAVEVRDQAGNLLYSGSDQVRFTSVEVHVQSMEFGGANHPIARDTDGLPYPTPHWVDMDGDGYADYVGARPSPVAYTRNTPMVIEEVRLCFKPIDLVFPATSFAALGPGHSAYGSLMQDECVLVGQNVQFVNPLGNMVHWFNVYPLGWTLMMNGYVMSGQFVSWTPLYVTLADPVAAPLYHSTIDIACQGANGLDGSDTDAVIAAIFPRFQNLNILRSTPDQYGSAVALQYYFDWNIGSTTVAELLAQADGQCSSWAKFFRQVLQVHNVHNGAEWTFAFPTLEFEEMLIHNWEFVGTGTSGAPTGLHPYLAVPLFLETIGQPGSQAHNWLNNAAHQREVLELPGVLGQGGTNPADLFLNHQFVRIGSTYYDPSYGLIYSDEDDFQLQAVAGFLLQMVWDYPESALGLDLDGDGQITNAEHPCDVFWIRPTLPVTSIYFEPRPWPN